MNKIVYIIQWQPFEQIVILGVFDDKELAFKQLSYQKQLHSPGTVTLEEYPLNVPVSIT